MSWNFSRVWDLFGMAFSSLLSRAMTSSVRGWRLWSKTFFESLLLRNGHIIGRRKKGIGNHFFLFLFFYETGSLTQTVMWTLWLSQVSTEVTLNDASSWSSFPEKMTLSSSIGTSSREARRSFMVFTVQSRFTCKAMVRSAENLTFIVISFMSTVTGPLAKVRNDILLWKNEINDWRTYLITESAMHPVDLCEAFPHTYDYIDDMLHACPTVACPIP